MNSIISGVNIRVLSHCCVAQAVAGLTPQRPGWIMLGEREH